LSLQLEVKLTVSVTELRLRALWEHSTPLPPDTSEHISPLSPTTQDLTPLDLPTQRSDFTCRLLVTNRYGLPFFSHPSKYSNVARCTAILLIEIYALASTSGWKRLWCIFMVLRTLLVWSDNL